MSENKQVPPASPASSVDLQAMPPVARRRYLRHVFWGGTGLLFLLGLGVVALYFWASSSTFENIIRKRMIARIEAATGGRAEIASFHWKLLNLEAEADGLVLHGGESAGEVPYAQLASMRISVDILGLWSPRLLLRNLELDRPQIHLIVYPNGQTNQPQPQVPAESHPLDTLFDLQAGHVEVNHGILDYDNRASQNDFQNRHIPLDFAANDVSLLMKYVAGGVNQSDGYHLDASVHDLRLTRGPTDHPEAPPVEGYFEAAADFTHNAAYLRSLRLTAHSKGAPDRVVNLNGELIDFGHPHWKANAVGEIDFKLVEPALGYPFTPEGIARVNLVAAGQSGEFRIDGAVHADNASYVGPGVMARGVGFDAHVHADALRLEITNVTAHLKAGGDLSGEVLLDHWIPPLTGAEVIRAAEPVKREKKGRIHEKLAVAVATPANTDLHTNGKVNARVHNVTLDTILDIVSLPPFQRLGLDARLNGTSTGVWSNGDVNTLTVDTKLSMTPSSTTTSGEAPTSGAIDGTYLQRTGSVDLRNLQVNLPESQLNAHGQLGAYPLTSPTSLSVELHSHNLGEFDKVLSDLGLTHAGKTGVAALPVTINGDADFQGSWTGSLVDPHLAGDLKATDFSLEIPSQQGAPQPVHWDSMDATGSYAAAKISIDHSQFRHGDATVSVDGTLTAARSPKSPGVPAFDEYSLVHANLHVSDLGTTDFEPLVGQKLPVSGLVSAQVTIDGPLNSLGGNGSVDLEKGAIYGEPLARAHVQGKIVNGVVQLATVNMSNAAGTLSASGNYDLHSKHFQVDAHGTGLDIAKIEHLRNTGTDLAGSLEFSVTGSGTVDDPHLEAHATLSNLAVSGQRFGALNLVAHAANHSVTYDLNSRFEAAELEAHGQTSLQGDNQTQATLNFSKFNIGALLTMAHVKGLTGESDLEGTVNLSGPMAHPEQMRGDASIKELAVTLGGVRLQSEGGLHASMGNSLITLDPLHVTGEETDVHLQGTLNLTGKRQVDVAANGSVNLRLAETVDPDLTARGTTTFRVEAHGPLENPGLSGRIDFENASLALEDLPNSLSQLHGTLEFNQNRLEVKSLTAMSGGGLLSVSGYLAYQHGIYADLALQGKSIRIRYPQGVSSAADINLQLQGPQGNLLLKGNVLITRFTVSPEMDFVALAAQAGKAQAIPPANAPSNHIRLDVRIQSSPQLNFRNAYAKLAGDVDLRLRGTVASPSLLGRISITEGNATIAGTRYELQRGEITFTNPVRIQPLIDLNATARVEDYDITLGLHGSVDQPAVTYRSDPPLPEADVVALLALGRTQDQQRLYTQQQEQLASNPATDALLGGALNATVSSRVQKLFGAGSVKVDPNYLGVLGNSTTRITVEEQLGKNLTLIYATDVDTTAQQLLQAEIAINRHVSLLVARDESGVFSMVLKATRRFK
jgi:translocation and assembly module TamB